MESSDKTTTIISVSFFVVALTGFICYLAFNYNTSVRAIEAGLVQETDKRGYVLWVKPSPYKENTNVE